MPCTWKLSTNGYQILNGVPPFSSYTRAHKDNLTEKGSL